MSCLARVNIQLFPKYCKRLILSSVQVARNHHCESTSDENYDIVIVGGGMIGSALACALACNRRLEDKKILIIEGSKKFKYEAKEKYSNRVVALNKNTRVLLSSIGAWKHIEAVRVAPVKKMQIWDACSDAMITFHEDQLSDELAYIVENDLLLHAVDLELSQKSSVNIINDAKINSITLSSKSNETDSNIKLENGQTISTKLLIGADGWNSRVREAMGAQYISWDYDQMAVVATLKLSEETENVVAWQRFLPTGPVALLPLNGSMSSLVWSTSIDEAKHLLKLTEEEFVDNLNDALWKIYPKDGVVEAGMKALQQLLEGLSLKSGINRQLQPSILSIIEGSRAAFPLSFGHSVQYVQTGVALIGDAAHKVHPLAGQGVNLGFGDICSLVQVLTDTVNDGAMLGDIIYLNKYERMRQIHNIPTMLAIDALHRLYKGTAAPIVLARSLGLQVTNAIYPIKKLIMQHAADSNTQRW